MQSNRKLWVLAPLLLLAGLSVWLIVGVSNPQVADQSPVSNSPKMVPGTPGEKAAVANNQVSGLRQELTSRLFGELELLREAHGEAEAHKGIQNLFAWLEQAPAQESAAAVVVVLRSGEDAFTFGRFSPGKDGYLTAYPTFRTALLDILEKMDPEQAVVLGKEILNTSENADEWALSLRALSRHGASIQDRAFLQSKVEDLLHKNDWLEEPSFAYLHAFDVAVQDGQSQTIERLGELVSAPPNRAVGHAATISVDRFFQQYPAVGSSYVLEHPEFLHDATGFRASLMARVNPVNSREMATAESYLQSQSVSIEEKRTFIQSFPNFNSTFSYNLITGSLLLNRAEMRERGTAAFRQLSNWLSEQRYPEFEDEINSTVNRLAKTWKLEQ